MRHKIGLFVLSFILLSLPVLATSPLMTDEVMVQYPAGFTKLLVVDIATLLSDDALMAGVIDPIVAANHPVSGLVRTVELFQIPAQQVQFAALGQGPDVTTFALIQGPSFAQTFGALQGLLAASRAPGSPYTHGEMVMLGTQPVIKVGGNFGPITIEWSYIPTENAIWVGSEVAFQPGVPDTGRLNRTTEKVVAKIQGAAGQMDELHIAVQVRGGQITFVRETAPGERLLEPGEQAMGFSLSLEGDQVTGRFALRFDSESAARDAAGRLENGTSPYLAQDVYRAELTGLTRNGRALNFEIATDLTGLVGLLFLVMPF